MAYDLTDIMAGLPEQRNFPIAKRTGAVIQFAHVPTYYANLKARSEGAAIGECFFKAFITNFKDTWKTNWNQKETFGRMDAIQSYRNTQRNISLSFDVPAHDEEEALRNFSMLQSLISMQYPVYEVTNYKRKKSTSDITQSSKGKRTLIKYISSPPLIYVKFANWISGEASINRELMDSVGASLMVTISEVSFNPDLEHGFFEGASLTAGNDLKLEITEQQQIKNIPTPNNITENQLLPKCFKVDLNMTVIHTQELGWINVDLNMNKIKHFIFGDSSNIVSTANPSDNSDTIQVDTYNISYSYPYRSNFTYSKLESKVLDRENFRQEQQKILERQKEQYIQNLYANAANEGAIFGDLNNDGVVNALDRQIAETGYEAKLKANIENNPNSLSILGKNAQEDKIAKDAMDKEAIRTLVDNDKNGILDENERRIGDAAAKAYEQKREEMRRSNNITEEEVQKAAEIAAVEAAKKTAEDIITEQDIYNYANSQQLLAKQQEANQELLNQFDANADGKLDAEETKAAREIVESLSDADGKEEYLKALDSASKKEISAKEFYGDTLPTEEELAISKQTSEVIFNPEKEENKKLINQTKEAETKQVEDFYNAQINQYSDAEKTVRDLAANETSEEQKKLYLENADKAAAAAQEAKNQQAVATSIVEEKYSNAFASEQEKENARIGQEMSAAWEQEEQQAAPPPPPPPPPTDPKVAAYFPEETPKTASSNEDLQAAAAWTSEQQNRQQQNQQTGGYRGELDTTATQTQTYESNNTTKVNTAEPEGYINDFEISNNEDAVNKALEEATARAQADANNSNQQVRTQERNSTPTYAPLACPDNWYPNADGTSCSPPSSNTQNTEQKQGNRQAELSDEEKMKKADEYARAENAKRRETLRKLWGLKK
jgi:hypothetical protein